MDENNLSFDFDDIDNIDTSDMEGFDDEELDVSVDLDQGEDDDTFIIDSDESDDILDETDQEDDDTFIIDSDETEDDQDESYSSEDLESSINNIDDSEDEFDDFGDSDIKSEDTEDKSDNDKSLEDLEAEIRALKDEIHAGSQPEGDADGYGSIVDSNALLVDDPSDSFEMASQENNFISPTGELVVMDPDDYDDAFKLIYTDIDNIAIAANKRIRLTSSVEDLVKSIKSTGLLKPIVVAETDVEDVYVLLDGYRRIMACARAGRRRIPCIINTKVHVQEIPILEAMYNHQKRYTIKEQIDYIDYLEKQKGIMSASMIEYLLQMNNGDYTKLKDILNDNDDDIVSKLMEGIYTIDAAFKKLEQRRKKESAEEKELKKATKVYEEDSESGIDKIEESGEMGIAGAELTDEEIKNLSINADDLDEINGDNLEDLVNAGNNIPGFQPHKQDPKYRERLDPTTRRSVLAKYNNTCQCCKISGMEYTEVLDVHHIMEVYLGGDDSIDNLIPLCVTCHKLVHLYGRGELSLRPLQEYQGAERDKFAKIIQLGNVIRTGMAARGMNVEKLKKLDNAGTIGRTKPGTGQEAG